MNGGSVTGNLLMGVSAQPNKDTANATLIQQFGQPIVSSASTNINSSANTIDATTAPAFVVSAASFADDAVAPDSLAAIFGTNLASQTESAKAVPLPTSIDGVTVTITDSAGIAHLAPLLFISPGQINFIVPSDCAPGAAVVAVASGAKTTGRGGTLVDLVAPTLLSADSTGTGAALGTAVLTHADTSQVFTPLTGPIDLGKTGDVVTLVLYGTGLRNRSTADPVAAYLGNQRLPVQYAGAQGAFAGLDQINVTLPAQFRGAGQLPLRIVAQGLSTNVVTVAIK